MKKTFRHKEFTAVFTDENGYFSFTGNVDGCCGAVGDKIVEIDDQFESLNKVHLCDSKTGEPTHAWANADYFWKAKNDNAFQKLLGIPDEMVEEYRQIKGCYASDNRGPVDEMLFNWRSRVEQIWAQNVEDALTACEDIPVTS